MQFTVEPVDIASRSPTVLLNESDAAELGVHPLDRVHLDHEGGTTVGIVELTDQLVPPGVVGTTRRLDAVTGPVDVSLAPTPASVRYIRKKLDDIELESREFERIVHDITEERLADVELGAYVAGVYANGLSLQETLHLTEQMTAVGEVVHDRPKQYIAEAVLRDEDGNQLGRASGSFQRSTIELTPEIGYE